MAVAEAMLAGCIPVVTKAGALPEVVGDTGIYINSVNLKELADAIQQALNLINEIRQAVRMRILNNFSLNRRRKALHDIVGKLLEK
jgi:glycosyltransferase involved in cell wall biosynthesis